jgi:hypothetical protein
VTFSSPAAATFAGGSSSVSATTNASGVANATTLTAGNAAGTFSVTATFGGAATATFSLTVSSVSIPTLSPMLLLLLVASLMALALNRLKMD